VTSELYAKMAQSVIDGEDDTAAVLAQKGLDMGLSAADILDKGFVKGIEEVGADGYAEDAIEAVVAAKGLLS
jgi:methanogenic corrinoid protein MtbC1